jgi:hypothetical protein
MSGAVSPLCPYGVVWCPWAVYNITVKTKTKCKILAARMFLYYLHSTKRYRDRCIFFLVYVTTQHKCLPGAHPEFFIRGGGWG